MLYARLLAALAVCALVKLGSCLSAPKGAAGKGRQREKQEAQWTRTGIVALRDAGITVHNAEASAFVHTLHCRMCCAECRSTTWRLDRAPLRILSH